MYEPETRLVFLPRIRSSFRDNLVIGWCQNFRSFSWAGQYMTRPTHVGQGDEIQVRHVYMARQSKDILNTSTSLTKGEKEDDTEKDKPTTSLQHVTYCRTPVRGKWAYPTRSKAWSCEYGRVASSTQNQRPKMGTWRQGELVREQCTYKMTSTYIYNSGHLQCMCMQYVVHVSVLQTVTRHKTTRSKKGQDFTKKKQDSTWSREHQNLSSSKQSGEWKNQSETTLLLHLSGAIRLKWK